MSKASLSFIEMKGISSVPEQMNLSSEQLYKIYNGTKQCTKQVRNIPSFNTSTANVNVDPPNNNVIIDSKRAYKRMKFRCRVNMKQLSGTVTYGFTNLTAAPTEKQKSDGVLKHWIGLRSNIGSKIINNETITLNGYNFTYKCSENAIWEEQYCSNRLMDDIGHMEPKMLDYDNEYDNLNGTLQDPFGKYQDYTGISPRGAFVYLNFNPNGYNGDSEVLDGVGKEFAFEFTIVTPIMASPFHWQDKGLTGINSMQYSCVFNNLLEGICMRIPKSNTGAHQIEISSIAFDAIGGDLLFTYYTPKLMNYYKNLKELAYDFKEFQNQKAPASIYNSASTNLETVNISNLNLSVIPEKVVIWGQVQNTEKSKQYGNGALNASVGLYAGLEITDTCGLRIEKIDVFFSNSTGIFSSASVEQLYEMSARNGYNGSFDKWYKTGGPVILDFRNDFPLEEEGYAVSVLDQPSLTIQCQVRRLKQRSVYRDGTTAIADDTKKYNFEVQYEVIYSGIASQINGVWSKQLQLLTKADVIKSMAEGPEAVSYHDCDKSGGFNPLTLLPMIPTAVKAVRQAIKSPIGQNVLKGVDTALEAVGAGNGGKISGKISGKKGGQVISRNEM